MSAPEQLVARLIFLPTLMIAVALLVKGYAEAGDGFAAGVVVSLGILLQYVALGREAAERIVPPAAMRAMAVGGLLIAFCCAFLPPLWGDRILTHWPPPGGEVTEVGSLELATPVVYDVGIALLVVGAVTGAMAIIARATAGRGG
jgi:multisubunit Na+/H+ antiporter MnhB subunit